MNSVNPDFAEAAMEMFFNMLEYYEFDDLGDFVRMYIAGNEL